MGKVILVGAGLADASFITVKGLEQIKDCDVIVYDRLVSKELLSFAKPGTIFVYAGKGPLCHEMEQDEINRTLVEYAKKYEKVVRLKGGDSFVFGRGGEEILALMQEGVLTEVVPGVTSAVAVPELAGIPVTHRGVSRSFHVIAGHAGEKEGMIKQPFDVYARLEGTLVFLMGLANLAWIAEQLMLYGRNKFTPSAVIADGASPKERIVRGMLCNIAQKVKEEEIKPPAVIVIGETAGFSLCTKPQKKEPVLGITGTPGTNERLINAIRESGIGTVTLMEMKTERLPGGEKLKKAVQDIDAYDWILFASRQAVMIFFDIVKETKTDIRNFCRCRFAVIGEGTKEALAAYGIYADFMPDCPLGTSFAEEFAAKYKNGKILIPSAKRSSGTLPAILKEKGFFVEEIPVYEVRGSCCSRFELAETLTDFVFFSSSGVFDFFAGVKERNIQLKAGLRIYCMGQSAKRALEDLANAPDWREAAKTWEIILPKEYTIDALAGEIIRYLMGKERKK